MKRSAELLIAALPTVVCLLGVAPAHAHLVPGVGLTVSLTATPVAGVTPLLVSFVANASPSSGTNLSWDFGDGLGLDGSAMTVSSPAHWYYTAGTFVARVTAITNSQIASANVTVHVLSSIVQVVAKANRTSASVPLTLAFSATATGGTGTYDRFLWQFGDGGSGTGAALNYTFQRPGQFWVTANVTDSQNHSGVGRVFVDALASADSQANTTVSGAPVLSTAGLAALAAIAVALASIGVGVYLVRRNPWSARSPGEGERAAAGRADSVDATTAGSPVAWPPESWPQGTSSGRATDVSGEDLLPEPGRIDGIAGGSEGAGTDVPSLEDARARATPSPRSARQLSNRVLVLLASEGALSPNDLPGPRRTQAGIAEALGTQQNVISKVVSRLEAAGVIRSETRHVRGQGRRVKVYSLTPQGEQVARELWSRRPDPRRSESQNW